MLIRMVIAVPLENLHATVKFFDKQQIVIRTTEFTPGNGERKKTKYLSTPEREQVARIKDRNRGQSRVVAEKFGVTAGVIRSIWRGASDD